jgi:membrane protease YdiL (CAAX protease family)
MRTGLWLTSIVATVGIADYFGFQLARAGSVSFWFILGVSTLLLAVLSAWQMHRQGQLRALFRPAAGDFARGLASMVVLFPLFYGASKCLVPAGSSAFSWTPGNHVARVYLQLGRPAFLHAHAFLLVAMFIALAVAEELVWRGFVTTLVEQRFGARVGWLYAAALSALAHVPSMWSLRDPITGLNPALPLAALGGGLVWGALTRRYRRLAPAILSHALFLWCVVIVFRLWGPNV